MPKKRYRPEDILSKLWEADILINQGKTVHNCYQPNLVNHS